MGAAVTLPGGGVWAKFAQRRGGVVTFVPESSVAKYSKIESSALNLNRSDLLNIDTSPPDESPSTLPVLSHSPTFVFISTYSCFSMPLKKLVNSMKADIKTLIGHDNIIFANKKNPNTASLLFCKSSFAQLPKIIQITQKCGTKNCLSCHVMTLPKEVITNGLKIKLDFSLNCKSLKVIMSSTSPAVNTMKFPRHPIDLCVLITINATLDKLAMSATYA